jgi:cytoskeletal protein RodZ
MIGWRSKPSTTEEDKPKGFDDFELRLGDLMRGERATLGKSLLDVQRELKIKATYIAAIENADVSAFETPGFVAGYVRSYARYLGMNPDWAFDKFCTEANFAVAHGMSSAASPGRAAQARTRAAVEFSDPLGNPNATFVPRAESLLSRVEPGAVGSMLVLVTLISGLVYGGWSLLQEVQRVQLAPVEQAPTVVAEIDPLGAAIAGPSLVVQPARPDAPEGATDLAGGAASPDLMDRLYRPEALDVPVLTARDGPIAAIDTAMNTSSPDANAVDAAVAEALQGTGVQVVASVQPGVEILAVRPSWVRVNAADGTVLFEKILDAGERYAVPSLEAAPVFRTGNSGSIYFVVNGQTYGPVAPGAQIVKDVALSPEALTATFAAADPEADADLGRFATDVADASAADPQPVSE